MCFGAFYTCHVCPIQPVNLKVKHAVFVLCARAGGSSIEELSLGTGFELLSEGYTPIFVLT